MKLSNGLQQSFVDMQSNPVWIGANSPRNYYVSRDDGMTYHNETMRKVWGTFFFVSNNLMLHNKSNYNIYDLLGDIGGFFEVMYAVFFYLPFWFNNFSLENKAIRLMYMEKQSNNSIQPLKLKKRDLILHILCRKKLTS